MLSVIVGLVISGLPLSVLAVAFSLVHRGCGVFHIALAALFAMAPVVMLEATALGLPWPLATLLALGSTALVGAGCGAANHNPLFSRRSAASTHLLTSLGIYTVLTQLMTMAIGTEPQFIAPRSESLDLLGVRLTYSSLYVLGVGLITLFATFALVEKSRLGTELLALSENSDDAEASGIRVEGVRVVGFALSGALAGVAGLLSALEFGFTTHGGLAVFLSSVVAVILGGRATLFWGAVVGSAVVVVLRGLTAFLWSSSWQDGITFVVLISFLLMRPSGIVGSALRLEARE